MRARQRRVGADDKQVGIAQQLDRLERALLQGKHGEGKVELAAFDQRQEIAIAGGFREADLDSRPADAELAQEGGQNARANALVDADAQDARGAFGEGGVIGLRGAQPGHDRVGVARQQRACLGQRD